ncbi:hypothetical protein Ate01nite_35690 [Actinoplanes teichomyceticus]|nr:hypothetical protein Ate01nite_35690 [Actinoplanes teichomyceticus]
MTAQPPPRFGDGRIVLVVDVSPWLRSAAACSSDRLFCHVYGRARSAAQFIPGWPYSFVAALEPGRTSWTAMLDVVRLGPAGDATAVTATQLHDVMERLIACGQQQPGDPNILIVCDAGYDVTRLAWALRDICRSRWPDAFAPTGSYGYPPRRTSTTRPVVAHPGTAASSTSKILTPGPSRP